MPNTSFSSGFASGAGAITNRNELRLKQEQQQQDQRNLLREQAITGIGTTLEEIGKAQKQFSTAFFTSKGLNDQKGMDAATAGQAQLVKTLWESTEPTLRAVGLTEDQISIAREKFRIGARLNNPVAEAKLEEQVKTQGDIATAGGKQQFNDFVRMQNDKGQAIAVRKGDQPPAGFVPVSATASKQDITTTALTKPNVTIQQANETGATQSALEARELSDKITASDVGLRGIGNVFMAETIGQIFDSAVDEDVLNNRQAALALKEKTLKSMSDDKRFSNLDRQALEKLFVSMGAFESVKSAKTKLLGLADILEERASFSAGLLGHNPLHELRKDEIVTGMKDGAIDYVTGRRALVNYHGFGE